MSSLKQALDRIDLWTDNNQTYFSKRLKGSLRPSVTRTRLHEVLGELNYFLPEEIYELYAWHNGTMEVGYTSETVYFCCIESVWNQIYVDPLTGATLVGSPYFPFMLADEWGAYVVCGDPDNSIEFSPVYFYNKDKMQADRLVAPSITNS